MVVVVVIRVLVSCGLGRCGLPFCVSHPIRCDVPDAAGLARAYIVCLRDPPRRIEEGGEDRTEWAAAVKHEKMTDVLPGTRTGLFAGLSLEGTVLIERKDANKDFYGSAVPARDILSGRVPPPEVASRLYEVIEAAEGIDESGLPENAYVPTASGDHMDIRHGGTVFDAEGH